MRGQWTLCTHPSFLGLHACNKMDAWPMDVWAMDALHQPSFLRLHMCNKMDAWPRDAWPMNAWRDRWGVNQ